MFIAKNGTIINIEQVESVKAVDKDCLNGGWIITFRSGRDIYITASGHEDLVNFVRELK